MRVLVLIAVLVPSTASAGIRDGKWISDAVMRSVSHHADVGVEGTLLASAGRDAQFGALGLDLTIGVFAEGLGVPKRRLRDELADRILRREQPRPAWPFLARPRFELHIGGTLGLDGEHHQARIAFGSGLGPVGLGIAAAHEWNAITGAFAVGPELRLRHRYGPAARSPSVGLVVRGDVFVTRRDTRDDRISVGVFGAFDVF